MIPTLGYFSLFLMLLPIIKISEYHTRKHESILFFHVFILPLFHLQVLLFHLLL